MLKYRGFVINRLSLIGAKFVCPFTRQKQIYKQKTYTKKKKKNHRQLFWSKKWWFTFGGRTGKNSKKNLLSRVQTLRICTPTLIDWREKMAMFQHTIRNKCISIYLRGNCHQWHWPIRGKDWPALIFLTFSLRRLFLL